MNNTEPKTYVFSIAIGDYTYLDKLPNAVKDAQSVIKVLQDKYKIEKIWQLEDAEVTQNAIKKTFTEIEQTLKQEDALLILYNGHGSVKGKGNIAYWQFQGSRIDAEQTWYKCSDFFDEITELEDIQHISLLVNSCFSGNLFEQDGLSSKRYDKGTGKKSRVLFTASLKNQTTRDSTKHGMNSPFCHSLIEILSNNKDSYELFLLNIVSYIHSQFDKNDFGSTPRYGHFKGNDGGQFVLYLKEDIEVIWSKTLKENSIEGYDSFIQKFPSSNLVSKAIENKKKLTEERESWHNTLDEITKLITPFVKEEHSSEIVKQSQSFLNNVKNVKNNLNESEESNNEWEELMKINNSNAKDTEKIKALERFIQNNKYSNYKMSAENILDNLRQKVQDEKLWKDVNNRTGKSLINIKRGYIDYIHNHKYGKHIGEANQNLRDVSLYMEAKDLITNNNDLSEGRKLLEEYKRKFPEGLYIKRAEKELNKVSIEARAKKIKLEFEEAKIENNLPALYDLVSEIQEFKKDEKEANSEVFTEAQLIITEYQTTKEKEYKKAIESNKVNELKFFIQLYSEDELAIDLVQEVQEALDNKEEQMFFEAERGKEIDLFKDLIEMFDENDNFYDKALQRTEELNLYFSLKTKEQYQKYLEHPQYKTNGLMLKEAKDHVKRIEQDELKQSQYDNAINSNSIEICQKYLDEYENDKDDKWFDIELKFKELDYTLRSKELFDEIIKATEIKDKLSLCHSYLSKYPKGIQLSQVEDIKEKMQKTIDSNDAFNIAVKTNEIEVLEDYKINHSQNHDKVDDYIDYLKAKQLKTKKAFEEYIGKYKDTTGLNIGKAKDGIVFLEALSTGESLPLHEYKRKSVEKEFEEEADTRIKELDDLKELEEEFAKANETEDIDTLSRYIRVYGDKNKEYKNKIIDKLTKLKRDKQDNEAFEAAKKSGKEEPLREYIGKYDIHITEASKLLTERRLGITEKDVNVIQKMNDNASAINLLTQEFQKTRDDNKLMVEAMNKSSNKKLLIIIGIVAIIIMGIYFVIAFLK
jgi:hypothetical protein